MTESLIKPFVAFAVVGGLLNACAWILILFFPQNESAAILHYTSGVGIDFVGEGRHIMVLPAVGTTILLLNLAVGGVIAREDKRTAWVMWSAIPIVQILLIIALVFLRNLNR